MEASPASARSALIRDGGADDAWAGAWIRRAGRHLAVSRSMFGAALLGMALAGCQGYMPVQTPIAPLPSGASYVSSVTLTGPSAQVDAGKFDVNPLTGKKEIMPAGSGMDVWTKDCVSCHAMDGKPSQAGNGAPDLTDPLFSWTKTPQEFFRDLLTSPAHTRAMLSVPGQGRTVSVSQLDRQMLWNATFYAWSLHSTPNDVVDGGFVYGRYCGVCHGTKGMGDGNLSGNLNPSPRRFTDFTWMVDKTDQRLYISISDGRPPSAMPAWKSTLSPTQRIHIINYLRAFTYKYPVDLQKKMAEQPPAS